MTTVNGTRPRPTSADDILARALERFDGLTPAAREEAAERRRTRRYAVSIPVQLVREGVSYRTTTRDLSKGGAFIQLEDAGHLYGTRIGLRLQIPGEAHPLLCEAEVRWTNDEGLGCQFLDMSPRGMYLLHRVFDLAAAG